MDEHQLSPHTPPHGLVDLPLLLVHRGEHTAQWDPQHKLSKEAGKRAGPRHPRAVVTHTQCSNLPPQAASVGWAPEAVFVSLMRCSDTPTLLHIPQ